MNEYGPSLVATGGGLAVGGLVWGMSQGNWVVIAVALFSFVAIAVSFVRLIWGEARIRNTGKD